MKIKIVKWVVEDEKGFEREVGEKDLNDLNEEQRAAVLEVLGEEADCFELKQFDNDSSILVVRKDEQKAWELREQPLKVLENGMIEA